MYRYEISAAAAAESPELGLDVCNRVIIARAIVLTEEWIDVAGSPVFAKTDVGHG